MKKTIATDFDEVIHAYTKGWQDGAIYDPPIEDANESMKFLVDKGFEVVIHTTRLSYLANGDKVTQLKLELEKWLKKNGFIKNKHYHNLTGEKPIAVGYIDDKAIRFTNWQDMIKHFV